MRRLLIIPAALLVLLGGPVLATESTAPPPATTDEVPVAPADQTVSDGWTSPETPVDANLVGVTWDGDPAAEFSVEVRGADGTWTKPTQVGADADNQAEPGTQDAVGAAQHPATTASEPVWIGNDATAVRVVLDSGVASNVTLATVDAEPAATPGGAAAAVAGLLPIVDGPSRYLFAGALFALAGLLVAIALGWSPWRRRKPGRTAALLALGALLIVACRPVAPPPPPPIPSGAVQPGMIMRAQWGARPFGTGPVACPGGPEYAYGLRFAVVHHTVNSNNYSPSDSYAMMRAIQSYHMNVNGYCDIAYNFIVDKHGQLFEARAGGITQPVIGGHAGGFNTASVGIALLGDYSNIRATTAQWNVLVHLLRWRLSVGRVDPAQGYLHNVAASPCNCQNWPPGTWVWFPNAIVTHRDVDRTACPGSAFYAQLATLRSQVQSGIVIPPTTTTSTSTTTTTVAATASDPTTTSSGPTSTTTSP